MAKKYIPDYEIPATLAPQDALKFVQRQAAAAEQLIRGGYIDEPKYKAWKSTTTEYLIQAFGNRSGNVTRFEKIDYVMIAPFDAGDGYWQARRIEWLKDGVALLGSCAEQLQSKAEILSRESSTSNLRDGKAMPADPKKVFVVHGRNEAARKATFDFLRALQLAPMEWNEVIESSGKGTPYVGEAIDAAFRIAKAVVVVLTGDDEVRLRRQFCEEGEEEREKVMMPQSRPNVIFEAGLAFGRHPQNTILVQIGNMRSISDLGGLHIVRYTGKADGDVEFRNNLATRLEGAGCAVNKKSSDWISTGDFRKALEFSNQKDKYD
jgi:predicted nucleotide-binding protein